MSSTKRLRNFKYEQLFAMKLLYKEQLMTPFLTIYYSTIDILGYISGTSFETFVRNYIKVHVSKLEENDLWGARNGVVHTNAPESQAYHKNKARRISYVWGKANIEDIERSIVEKGNTDKDVAIRVEELYEGLRVGIDQFIEDLQKDSKLCVIFEQRIENCFIRLNPDGTIPEINETISLKLNE